MEHNKIKFAREYCRQRHIPYRIKDNGIDAPLFIDRKQVCFSLYNLTELQISQMIDTECIYDEQGNYMCLAYSI